MANDKGCEELEKEFMLAREMKEKYCDKSGQETDINKASEILHRIGLIYRRRSPDKISLIKSAGLLNAAIVRNPSNISQIKSDLSELCRHILQEANAKDQSIDLIKKAKQVKFSIMSLRNEVEEYLKKNVPKISANASKQKAQKEKARKISAIKSINKKIAGKYRLIMKNLSQFCEDVMGKPIIEYAIVGMGSLAREEITPYSDFEHIIILSDDQNCHSYLEHFRWFSVIFHTVILNVQETIVPSLNIGSLNDKDSSLGDWYYDAITPRGISFDGMMPHACKFPLGRQQHTKKKSFATELIKPVSEMLEYLSSEADLKNGYHLADILTKTCFVFGSKEIFKQFTDGTQKYRETKSQTDNINDIQYQVKEDLNNFSTRFRLTNLKSQDSINIKQLVYRSTTIFVAALARVNNISANSCFDIIDNTTQTNLFTDNTADTLRYAISIACEFRLRVYMSKKSQCDNAINLKQEGIDKFLDIVGVTSTISYFQIAYCLQCEVAKQLNFTKLHFYSDSKLINFSIGLVFGIKHLTTLTNDFQNRNWDSSKFDFDTCIKQLESDIRWSPRALERFGTYFSKTVEQMFGKTFMHQSASQARPDADQIKSIATYLHTTQIYDEAVEFYKVLLGIYEDNVYSEVNSRDSDIDFTNFEIGLCLNSMNQPLQGLQYLHRTLKYRQKITVNADRDRSIAEVYQHIGYCHFNLLHCDKALTYLNKAHDVFQNTTLNAKRDERIASTLHYIGHCHIRLQQIEIALSCLKQALEIKENTTHNADMDASLASTLNDVGLCCIDLQKYDSALNYLNRAIEITENTSSDVGNDRKWAAVQQNIGRCLTGMQQYDSSWARLEQSLKVFEKLSLDKDDDRRIIYTFNYMGECLIGKQPFAEALTLLQKALKYYQSSSTNVAKDGRLAKTLHNIGFCLSEMQEYADALNHLQQSLNIYENFESNQFVSTKIQAIRSKIDDCFLKLG